MRVMQAEIGVRAAQHGRSMEDHARDILRQALAQQRLAARELAQAVHPRLAALGGVELVVGPRDTLRDPPMFGR